MKNIGTELEPTALARVQGGGFSFWGNDSGLDRNATRVIAHAVVDAGKVVYQVGKSIWHAISSWF